MPITQLYPDEGLANALAIQGKDVSGIPPVDGQVLTFDAATQQYVPIAASGGGGDTDIEITDPTKGVILRNPVTNERVRITINAANQLIRTVVTLLMLTGAALAQTATLDVTTNGTVISGVTNALTFSNALVHTNGGTSTNTSFAVGQANTGIYGTGGVLRLSANGVQYASTLQTTGNNRGGFAVRAGSLFFNTSAGIGKWFLENSNVIAQINDENYGLGNEYRIYGSATNNSTNYRRLSVGMSNSGIAYIRPEQAGPLTNASNELDISGLPRTNQGSTDILWNDRGLVKATNVVGIPSGNALSNSIPVANGAGGSAWAAFPTNQVAQFFHNGGIQQFAYLSTAQSNGTSLTAAAGFTRGYVNTGTSPAGSYILHRFGSMFGWKDTGGYPTQWDFAKAGIVSFSLTPMRFLTPTANDVMRVTFGIDSKAVGDITNRGFGFKLIGTTNWSLDVFWHDGTNYFQTNTSVAFSTTAPSFRGQVSWDGTGNLTWIFNGTNVFSVAGFTNQPSTMGLTIEAVYGGGNVAGSIPLQYIFGNAWSSQL
jgi:hypothetical protein